jgi:hypothetical protein
VLHEFSEQAHETGDDLMSQMSGLKAPVPGLSRDLGAIQ